MGLFGDLDVTQFDDDPWNIPDDKHPATITESFVKETKSEDKLGWTIVYTIQDGPARGQNVKEWKRVPELNTRPMKDDARAGAFLKERLISLGIPESRMNDATPEELLGKEVYVTTRRREKNGQVNFDVTKVELRSAEASESDGDFASTI